MAAVWVLLLVSLSCINLVEAATYLVVAPRYITSRDYKMTVWFNTSSSVDVAVLLSVTERSSRNHNQPAPSPAAVRERITVDPGSTTKISLRYPEGNNWQRTYTYTLEVTASNRDGFSIKHSDTLNLAYRNNMSIFIQMDKVQYKPGDTVRFRTFALDPYLKPLNIPVDITVLDSAQNKVFQILNKTCSHGSGLVSSELRLSDQPNTGLWTVLINQAGKVERKRFLVEEYVLPKFEVKVHLAKYGLRTDDKFRAIITAKYTFGQPVEGNISTVISPISQVNCDPVILRRPYHSAYRTPCRTLHIHSQLDKQGRAELSIPIADMVNTLPPIINKDGGLTSPTINNLNRVEFMVQSNVTEVLTGKQISANATMKYASPSVKMEFSPLTPNNFKPGLHYQGYIQLQNPDGSTVDPDQIRHLSGEDKVISIRTTYICLKEIMKYAQKGCQRYSYTQNVTVDYPSGVAVFQLETPVGYESMDIMATFTDKFGMKISSGKSVLLFVTRDGQAIQLSASLPDASLKPGSKATFTVNITEPINTYFYSLMGKSDIVEMAAVTEATPFRIHQFTVDVTATLAQQLAPAMTVLVNAATRDDEMIADSLTVLVDGTSNNKVGISFSQNGLARNTSRPGAEVDIEVRASAHSRVGILAVDQSVRLQRTGNDITQEMVNDGLAQMCPGGVPSAMYSLRHPVPKMRSSPVCTSCHAIYDPSSDVSSLIRNTRMIVFTDSLVYGSIRKITDALSPVNKRTDYLGSTKLGSEGFRNTLDPSVEDMRLEHRGPEVDDVDDGHVDDDGDDDGDYDLTIRSNFAEILLWNATSTGDDGRSVVAATLPDAITSWVATAFALHPDDGIGISEAAMLTTFKPFFVSLSLPYSVVRGEEFLLKAVVFNYMETEQEVEITLGASDDFQVLQGSEKVHSEMRRKLKIAASDAERITFWIIPQKIGSVSILVKARSQQAGDAILKTLLVEAEGVEREHSETMLIHRAATEATSQWKMTVNIPQAGLVHGSQHVKVTAIGDIMGKTLNNLGRLVRMPSGCGEQNMIKFAPDVFAIKYLTASGQLTQEIEQEIILYLQTGYQRELTFKRSDGSYSAFGDYDPAGSTWLTAFVLRSFQQATPYVTIDTTKIPDSLAFLAHNQNKNGSFAEPGRLIHGNLNGGSGNGTALTAYILMALLENRNNSGRYRAQVVIATNRALSYLEGQVSGMTDVYTLAITCLALKKAGSSHAIHALDRLNQFAIEKDGVKHWEAKKKDDNEDEGPPAPVWRRYLHPTHDVEMTSYALLAYIEFGRLQEALPIVKWLVSQQNGYGGFRSTQDTVVGLNALAEFAELLAAKTGGQEQNINVGIRMDGGVMQSFQTLTHHNKIVLQSIQSSDSVQEVEVTATGSGFAVIQLVVTYNVVEVDNSPSVNLTVDSTRDDDVINVHACAQWMDEAGDSGMGIIAVQALSGFTFDSGELQSHYRKQGLKKVETSGKNLHMYFDQIPSDRQLCVQVPQYKTDEIVNLRQASVSAYSYYSPEKSQTTFYLPQMGRMDPCDVCQECCDGENLVHVGAPHVHDNSGGSTSPRGSTLSLVLATITTLMAARHYRTG